MFQKTVQKEIQLENEIKLVAQMEEDFWKNMLKQLTNQVSQ